MKVKRKDPGMGGMLGEVSFVRKVRRRVEVTTKPVGRKAPTDNQAAAQARFLEAAQYAKRQTADPVSLALYTTGITASKRTAHMVAMCDYLGAPKVGGIDTADYRGNVGDTLSVKATDDFMVTRVRIEIRDAAGAIIEEGDAGPDSLQVNNWNYQATVTNPVLAGTTIKATAYDRPRNKTSLEVKL